MSIQNSFDIAIIGNATMDDVYRVNGWATPGSSNEFISYKRQIGGIGNILEALSGCGLRICAETVKGEDPDGWSVSSYVRSKSAEAIIHTSDDPTTKALILSDVTSSERTSFVKWGCGDGAMPMTPVKADWVHVSYLDVLADSDVAPLRTGAKVLSADLCLSKPSLDRKLLVCEKARHLDVLFASDAEFAEYSAELMGVFLYNQDLRIVVHSVDKTSICAFHEHCAASVDSGIEMIKYADVLGAGDAYCANFILAQLKGLDMSDSAKVAHEGATKFIRKRMT